MALAWALPDGSQQLQAAVFQLLLLSALRPYGGLCSNDRREEVNLEGGWAARVPEMESNYYQFHQV